MTKLKYTLKTDTLFKLLFTKYPDLLRRLVAALLSLQYEEIKEFNITNPEILPETLGNKFCRLDINMIVNGQKVDIEVQVADEGNYPERSLYYWAREFSSGLNKGADYSTLPRTIIISILGFNQFPDLKKFHSEYRCLETTTQKPLTDKVVLHYYELKKLPPLNSADNSRDLWLKLFKAETEEDLAAIEKMGVPIMSEAIVAYRNIAASPELLEVERMRSKSSHDEAQALKHAEQRGEQRANEKWQVVVAERDVVIADKDALIAELQAKLGNSE